MTHITCRLTAKNRDQLRNRTLGNRVWATFLYRSACIGQNLLTTGGFCWCKVLLPACLADSNQLVQIREKMLESATLSPYLLDIFLLLTDLQRHAQATLYTSIFTPWLELDFTARYLLSRCSSVCLLQLYSVLLSKRLHMSSRSQRGVVISQPDILVVDVRDFR